MELTREEIERYANPNQIQSMNIYQSCFVETMAKQLLSEMDKPHIQSAWLDAPDWASRAWIQWRNESGTHMEWREEPYTRELPKSPEREIAEKTWARLNNVYVANEDDFINAIEAAINEYKESVK